MIYFLNNWTKSKIKYFLIVIALELIKIYAWFFLNLKKYLLNIKYSNYFLTILFV